MKTVSDRIFELLKERKMTQKEFAQRTGIAECNKGVRCNKISIKWGRTTAVSIENKCF